MLPPLPGGTAASRQDCTAGVRPGADRVHLIDHNTARPGLTPAAAPGSTWGAIVDCNADKPTFAVSRRQLAMHALVFDADVVDLSPVYGSRDGFAIKSKADHDDLRFSIAGWILCKRDKAGSGRGIRVAHQAACVDGDLFPL